MRRFRCYLVAVVLLAATACAPAMKMKPQASSRARVGTRVALRALDPAEANTGPTVRGACPVDVSLRELTCPVQSAVVEVVFSGDGRVASSKISRSSGIQALDLGCMLATNSCVVGQSSKQAALECSLQCE